MTIHALMVSSGNGPGECRQAVAHVLEDMQLEAQDYGVEIDMSRREAKHGPVSAVVIITGDRAADFARRWEGVVLWRCQSQLRPAHRRKNWFVQVFRLPPPPAGARIAPEEVEMQAMRAGGPGGQHQNKTSSAIRARWVSSEGREYHVAVRDSRSQHQNRRIAVERLEMLLAQDLQATKDAARAQARLLHHDLQRGDPARVYSGPRFTPGYSAG